jgi:cytochrome c-type biogenesis protein CcmH/NrfG
MRAEAVVFAVAGTLFGLLVGWMLGSQQARSAVPVTPPAQTATATPPPAQANAAQPATRLDQGRVQDLRAQADGNPKDPAPRVQLGNLFFDAEQYSEAISWYESALALNPKDPDVSTDLGVAYYYTNQPDRAIQQFELSLGNDPKHTKTLLNLGIVKAFGKQDLAAAAQAWQQVVALAPNSPEGQAAKKALDGLQGAHPGTGSPPPSGGQ